MSPLTTPFFVTGGNLPVDAPSYITRQADQQLYDSLRRGEFCAVLDARQLGKSSLMVRTASRLQADGVATVAFELTTLGANVSLEQWYFGLLGLLGQGVHLEDAVEDYWLAHRHLGPLQRWMAALNAVVLAQVTRPLVIFVDEIDYVRALPFSSDEFFAAIRECYNRRAQDPAFRRLTFCLLGAAAPADVIRDPRTTPFNIGQRLELSDFSAAEARPLAAGLGRPAAQGQPLLDRALYWTGGHPYMTQRLCQAVAEDASVATPAAVDRHCAALFLTPQARSQDNNLRFVSQRLLSNEADRASVLDLYARVQRRQRVRDDDTNPLVTLLRLAGITQPRDGLLQVRNRIYAQVFDRAWIKDNMPDAELRRQRAAVRRGVLRAGLIAGVVLAVLTGLFLDARTQRQRAEQQTAMAQRATQRAEQEEQRAEQQAERATKEAETAKQAAARAERNVQHALNAANTMVGQLVYGLQPLLGTQSTALEQILRQTEGVLQQLYAEAGDTPEVRHSMAIMLSAYSDIYRQLGDMPQALSRAIACQDIMQQLVARDPDNTQWQRDLAVSHIKVGDVQVAQGQLAAALQAYQASQAIAEGLAQRDPSNTEWQRDLAVSHNNVGNVQVAQGQLAAALQAYLASRAIREALAHRDPSNTQWQRDLAVSYQSVGLIQQAQGQQAEALLLYQQSLAIRERLAQRDPSNAEWREDLQKMQTLIKALQEPGQ